MNSTIVMVQSMALSSPVCRTIPSARGDNRSQLLRLLHVVSCREWRSGCQRICNRETSVAGSQVVHRKLSGIEKVAIQGESGSNSHMAALEMLGTVDLVPCSLSADVFDRLLDGSVDAAVLPIANSLDGSVGEPYAPLLQPAFRITGEGLLRIRFHLIAMPGVALTDLRRVLSHPVALAQ